MAHWVRSNQTHQSWLGGLIRIFNQTTPELGLSTDDLIVREVLDCFTVGSDPEEVISRFEDADRDRVRTLIRSLVGIAVLIPDTPTDPESPGPALAALKSQQALDQRRRGLGLLKYDDLGLTVTNCGSQELSPGCQACKSGAWLCVFVGLRCNATCPFCPQPAAARTIDEGSLGSGWVDQLLATMKAYGSVLKGVSMSGGEPFLYEDVVGRIVPFVREHLPGVYQWAYTNGTMANADSLRRFRDFGLDEIRFNLAASGFDSRILAQVADSAVGIFPWVTVEVPVYETTYDHLIKREKLSDLDQMGVKQLNLGQLFAGTATSPVMKNLGDRFCSSQGPQAITAAMVKYRNWTYDIFEYAYKMGLAIRINDCSEDAKKAQMLSRQHLGGGAMYALLDCAYPRPMPPTDLPEPPRDAERTPSGLAFKTLARGEGTRTPADHDTVAIRYIGWTKDRRVFDSSYRSGLEAVVRRVGDQVPGLSMALASMTVGERRLLWIPEDLTTGAGQGESPGPLVFDLELVDISSPRPPC